MGRAEGAVAAHRKLESRSSGRIRPEPARALSGWRSDGAEAVRRPFCRGLATRSGRRRATLRRSETKEKDEIAMAKKKPSEDAAPQPPAARAKPATSVQQPPAEERYADQL